MARKRVILHAGAHKTGTTALQAFFGSNAGLLEKSGVHYPFADPMANVAAGTCSGNLVQILTREGFMYQGRKRLSLRDALEASEPSESQRKGPAHVPNAAYFKRVKSIIEEADASTVLLSGELFIAMSLQQMEQFRSIVGDAHDVEAVVFVRDVFDFLSSAWRQVLKRRNDKRTFDQYVHDMLEVRGISMIHGLDRMREAGLNVTVVNYDTYRRDIASAFLSAAKIELAEPPAYLLAEGQHNRSLGSSEAPLVQKVNSTLAGTGFPPTFVRHLLDKGATRASSAGFYSREQHGKVLTECGVILKTINDRIVGGPLDLEVRDAESTEPPIAEEDIDILLASFREAATFKRRTLRARNLVAKVWARMRYRFVPTDFNADAYLVLNEDVAQSKQDPYVHYALFGRFEGRQYKYL